MPGYFPEEEADSSIPGEDFVRPPFQVSLNLGEAGLTVAGRVRCPVPLKMVGRSPESRRLFKQFDQSVKGLLNSRTHSDVHCRASFYAFTPNNPETIMH